MRNWSNAGNNGESSAYFCSRQKMVFRTIANFFLSRGRLNRAFLNVVSFAPDLYAALTSRGWGEVNCGTRLPLSSIDSLEREITGVRGLAFMTNRYFDVSTVPRVSSRPREISEQN